jgi:hypothetical protein
MDRAQTGAQRKAIGRCKGGMTTKILALTDVLGNLVRLVLMPGHRYDSFHMLPHDCECLFDGWRTAKSCQIEGDPLPDGRGDGIDAVGHRH